MQQYSSCFYILEFILFIIGLITVVSLASCWRREEPAPIVIPTSTPMATPTTRAQILSIPTSKPARDAGGTAITSIGNGDDFGMDMVIQPDGKVSLRLIGEADQAKKNEVPAQHYQRDLSCRNFDCDF